MTKSFTFFLCADSKDEATAIQSTLYSIDPASRLVWVRTADELFALFDNGQKPDFVFLCSHIMEQSGPRILSQIREKADFRRLPIVVYTGASQSEYVEIAFEKGTDLFTHKTVFLKSDVRFVLEKLLTMYRQGWSVSRREGFAVFIEMATGAFFPVIEPDNALSEYPDTSVLN